MATTSGRILWWSDPLLGEFVWIEGDGWNGTCEFNGRIVRLQLSTDYTDPTREQQVSVFEPSRPILDRLREVEPEFRRVAAKQLAAAVVSQQTRGPQRVALPQRRFAEGLELQAVSIHGCGELHYSSSEFFPGWIVTIFFFPDVSFADAEVCEPRKPAPS